MPQHIIRHRQRLKEAQRALQQKKVQFEKELNEEYHPIQKNFDRVINMVPSDFMDDHNKQMLIKLKQNSLQRVIRNKIIQKTTMTN